MDWKGLPIFACVVAVASCTSHPPLPPPPAPVEITDVEIPIVEIPGIDDVALLNFEPAPFAETAEDGEVLASDSELPSGIDFNGYDMAMELNDRVQFWIDLFTGRERNNFARYLSRQGIYEAMINERLAARGMPSELLYLALIESGFSPVARSKASAVGLWQFVAGTARIEGLEVSQFVDDRRNADRATDAALQHLQRLYDRFGSWYLAAAAYNSGAGRVERALSRRADGARGHDSLFWQIHAALPRETRDYVPKLIAATVLARNRDRFGFTDIFVQQPVPLDSVVVPDATDLDVIADAAGVPKEVIVELNPHYYRGVTPPNREALVLVPDGRAEPFATAYAEIPPEQRVRFREHVVRRGETLGGIAQTYGTTVAILQEANGISRPNRISIGQRIRIPSAGSRPGSVTRVASTSSSTTTDAEGAVLYRVRRGDSMWSIARTHGISLTQLMRWNRLTERSIIKPGDRLIVRQPG